MLLAQGRSGESEDDILTHALNTLLQLFYQNVSSTMNSENLLMNPIKIRG